MDFQVASDLHLEFRGVERAPTFAMPIKRSPMLLLAGDVCPAVQSGFESALARIANPFDVVLYVPGNHEYYGFDQPVLQVDSFIEKTCFSHLSNVIYMNEKRIDIGGIAYIGATLWTNCPLHEPMINDFDYIDGGNFTPSQMNALHRRHADFIRRAIKQAKRDGLSGAVVLTHHAPDVKLASYSSGRRSKGGIAPYYYASDMQDVVNDPFVQVFAHGHTHESYKYQKKKNGTVYISNSLGYPTEPTKYVNGGAVLRYT